MDRRRYVRHPIRVPMSVRREGQQFRSRAGDISEGGVSFDSGTPLAVGSTVEVQLPVHHTRFTLAGTVASCVALEGGFRVGVSFVETGVQFKMKLAEQVLRIDELRLSLTQERGVEVTTREAAQVWVEQYASTFADLFPSKG